jgi:integrase
MPDVPAEERNLALLCKRALEMDVPEMMASFMTERRDQPWEFYRDYSRQLWDEARHAMMGTVALAARGVDWMREVPLNVSFSLRLNLHATPVERQMMLYAIEQSLMPGETGKRFEYETALAAGDALSAHFQDYDWADEVLHAQIGRRMLKREDISSEEARERAKPIHEKTWAALDQYRSLGEQHDWWPDFVRKVLGKESAAPTRPALNIFSE